MVNGCIEFVDERHHIGGVAKVALGQMQAEEKARPHLDNDAWLFPELSDTVTLSFFKGAYSVLRRWFLSLLHRHSQGVQHWHIEPVYTDSRKHPIVLT